MEAILSCPSLEFLDYEGVVAVAEAVWGSRYYPTSIAGESDQMTLAGLRARLRWFAHQVRAQSGHVFVLSPKCTSVVGSVPRQSFAALVYRVFFCLGPTLAVCTDCLEHGVASMTDIELWDTDVVVW